MSNHANGNLMADVLVPLLAVLIVAAAAVILWAVMTGIAPSVTNALKVVGLVIVWAVIILPPLWAILSAVIGLFA